MRQRPLIPVALLYVLGILLAAMPVSLAPLFGLTFAAVLMALLWEKARRWLLCASLILVGWSNMATHTAVISPIDLRNEFTRPEEIVTLRGVLAETPYHRVHEIKNIETWSSMARLQVSQARRKEGDWFSVVGEVISSTKEFLPTNFFAGQVVEVSGVLRQARRPIAEGLFDYRNFLRRQEIYYQFEIKKVSDWQIVASPPRAPLADRFCAWARKSLALGLPNEDESVRLEWAMSLGWKAALTDEVEEPFMKSATFHIFAVDGLRVAIIGAILLGLVSLLGVPREWRGLAVMPFLLFYAAMTGWPASAIRAIVMIGVIFGGWALARPSDFINSLFAAALLILLWQPNQLFQAGFQLSFCVVLSIILISPFFKRVGEWILRTDPLRPESLQPWWEKILRDGLRGVVDLFLASLAAWLGSIPLVALYFHLFTPVSGPANLIAVPLCMLVLICNMTSLLFVSWLPWLAIIFNHAGWFFMECIRATSNWSANLPGAFFYVAMPGLFAIALYYFILIGGLSGWFFRDRWKWKVSVAGLMIFVWCGMLVKENVTVRVTVLPLNGGHAVYLAGWDDWLIDCGNEPSVDAVTTPFLEAQGVNRLAHFIITHGEIGYSGGAKDVLKEFRPRDIRISPIRFRSPEYREFTEQHSSMLDASLRPNLDIHPWTVPYPPPDTPFPKADDNCVVLLGNLQGTRLLLLSDLSHTGQNALLNSAREKLRADIVVAALPGEGEGEPLGDALLDAIHPAIIVIADSTQPAIKRAGEKLKERLATRGVPVIYTSASDAVTVSSSFGHWQITAMDGQIISGTNSGASR
jgi:ComEC/Rec2-related protein